MMLFRATAAATVNISVGSSSSSVKLANQGSRIQVRVYNAGTATVWIAFGDSTVAASASNGIPIAPGYTGGFSVDPPQNDSLYVAAVAAGSTGSIYFTPGVGL